MIWIPIPLASPEAVAEQQIIRTGLIRRLPIRVKGAPGGYIRIVAEGHTKKTSHRNKLLPEYTSYVYYEAEILLLHG